MRLRPGLTALFTSVLLTSTLLCTAAASPPVATIDDMGFLAGTWRGSLWGGEFTAYYSTPEGGKVLSYSELRKEGNVAFYEFERFETRQDTVVFTPFPGGKPAIDLELTELDPKNRKATFENPTKDFPTRIVYHVVGKDRLVITLSDPHHESDKTEVYDLKRVGD